MNLTARQWQIALLVTEGLSNKGIARKLGIMEGTVKVQMHEIFQRLGIEKRTKLAMMVVEYENKRKSTVQTHTDAVLFTAHMLDKSKDTELLP
jgi:DNA-binding CsgD family transcriptional regulator